MLSDPSVALLWTVNTVYGHMLWRAVWPRRPDPDEKDR